MKRYARTDANQDAVVDALRAIGCTVNSLAALGCGVPDLLVGRNGVDCLVEVKDGDKSPSQKQLTDDQKKWHKWWKGAPVLVVESPEGAVLAVLERTKAKE